MKFDNRRLYAFPLKWVWTNPFVCIYDAAIHLQMITNLGYIDSLSKEKGSMRVDNWLFGPKSMMLQDIIKFFSHSFLYTYTYTFRWYVQNVSEGKLQEKKVIIIQARLDNRITISRTHFCFFFCHLQQNIFTFSPIYIFSTWSLVVHENSKEESFQH